MAEFRDLTLPRVTGSIAKFDSKNPEPFAASIADLVNQLVKFTQYASTPLNGLILNKQITRTSQDTYVIGGTGGPPLVVPSGGTGRSTLTDHALLVGSGTDPVDFAGPGAKGLPLVAQGASADPAFAVLTVPGGGTGQATLTDHGVLVGSGTAAVDALAAGATGTVLKGNTGADPSFTPNMILGSAALGIGTVELWDGVATDYAEMDFNNNILQIIFPNSKILNIGGGIIRFDGTTSGTVRIQLQAAAGTYNFNLPTTAGTTGQPLLSAGGGASPMTFGTLGVPGGGTGGTTLTDHSILLGNAADPVEFLGPVASGRVLVSAGTSADPIQTATPVLGLAGTTLGSIGLSGNTSGVVTIKPLATAGTYNFNLPNTAGTSGDVLTSAGGGTKAMTWSTPTGGTVTSITIASANGFAGSSSGGATPALTLSTTVTGILSGNGTAISAASTTGSGAVVLAAGSTLTSLTTAGSYPQETVAGTGATDQTGILFTQGGNNRWDLLMLAGSNDFTLFNRSTGAAAFTVAASLSAMTIFGTLSIANLTLNSATSTAQTNFTLSQGGNPRWDWYVPASSTDLRVFNRNLAADALTVTAADSKFAFVATISAASVQPKAGASTSFAKAGGVLFDHFADAGNVGTGEDDLYSDTIPASTLSVNGAKLEAEYGGSFVSSATATRQIKVFFGGTAIFSTGALTLSLSSAWTVYVTIIRVSASVVRYMVSLATEGAALSAYTAVGELTGLTLSSTNVLKITGEAAGVGAATDDIVAKLGAVYWHPSA